MTGREIIRITAKLPTKQFDRHAHECGDVAQFDEGRCQDAWTRCEVSRMVHTIASDGCIDLLDGQYVGGQTELIY